jgi:hypothetical protein
MKKRVSLFWGGILIILAGLLLLKQMGLIEGDPLGYFWPLVVIGFGLWLILGFFTRGQQVEGEPVSIPLEGAASATIKLRHAAGKLNIHAGAEPGELINGTFCNGLRHKSQMVEGRLEASLRGAHQSWVFWPGDSQDWDVHLNDTIPLSLKLDSGASASILDLSGLKIKDLDIDTGASSTELTLPTENSDTHVEIDTGASSFEVSIPSGVAASIRVKSGIASVKVDARFPRVDGGLYRSADYDTSTNRVDLTISTGVGSIEIR